VFALTHPANITVSTLFSFAALTNFQAKTSMIAFSISKLNSILSFKLNFHFSCFLLSISFLILVLSPEKLKLNSFFTNQTRGKSHL
jgi:hypothetical protein